MTSVRRTLARGHKRERPAGEDLLDPSETNPVFPRGHGRRGHQLADCFKDHLEVGVILLFEFIQPPGEVLEVQWIMWDTLIEIERGLGLKGEFPDSFLDLLDSFDVDTVSPATFLKGVAPAVRELLKGRSSPHLPFDLLADVEAGTADDTPWIQKLDPNRLAERVEAYPKASAVTASRDTLPPPPVQEGSKRPWEKYRYQ